MLRLVIASERMGSVIEIFLIRKGFYSSGVIQYVSLCFSPTLFFDQGSINHLTEDEVCTGLLYSKQSLC
jgi:hypothetical protein